MITFTTSSAIENFCALGLSLPNETKVATSSTAISKAARGSGLRVELEAGRDHLPGLVEAIQKYYRGKS